MRINGQFRYCRASLNTSKNTLTNVFINSPPFAKAQFILNSYECNKVAAYESDGIH